ncbi:uncharacterized protein P7C70_g6768, partial [Phenoliferia sp. Uapishka_3]
MSGLGIKRQFGLAPDPYRHETVDATDKLPKLVKSRYQSDSDQPGFPVYHRHIASPLALGALAFGAAMFCLGLCLVHTRGVQSTVIFIAIGLPYGGLGVMISGFPQGNTFGFTLFTLLGGVIMAFTLPDIAWFGIQTAYLEAASSILQGVADLEQAISIVAWSAFVIIFVFLFASLKTSLPVFGFLLVTALGMLLYAVEAMKTMDSAGVGAGALWIVVGLVLFYVAAADMLADEGFHFLPLFTLPVLHK